MRIKESTVYTFDELDESAKERAREWYRGCIDVDDYSEWVLNDANTIARMLGIDISTRMVKLMGGGTRQEEVWYWDLDRNFGACFSGRYRYAKGSVAKVREHAPKDEELHAIARGLYKAQKPGFYRGVVDIDARDRSMSIGCDDVSDSDAGGFDYDAAKSALESFAHWVAGRLRDAYEYQVSDEVVDESIRANEYEFDEEGRRA